MTLTEKFEKNIDQVNSDFQAIKSKLIECGIEVPDGTKTAELAEKVGEVYNSGRKAENEAFWDAYQQNGNRTQYNYAFSGEGWTNETFNPKYNIVPTIAWYMFQNSNIMGDLVEKLENLGVTLDFSNNIYNATNTFINSKFSRLGILDFSKAVKLNNTFSDANFLETIDKLIVSATLKYETPFYGATALKNIIVEGIIGQNGFDVSACTNLSKASIISIINALSTTTSGLTVTFSKTAVDNAFKDGDRIGSESQEWETLAQTKSNWTISLI